MANILIASDIAEVAKRQQTTWLVLQLHSNYRSQGKIGGEELALGSKALAEDVLELDYTLAAKRVVAVMRNLMKGDEEEVDEALRMALTWYEASKARERPAGGPVFRPEIDSGQLLMNRLQLGARFSLGQSTCRRRFAGLISQISLWQLLLGSWRSRTCGELVSVSAVVIGIIGG